MTNRRRPRRAAPWRLLAVSAVLAVAAALWLSLRPGAPPKGAIPPPLGGPQIAQDVNTMLGRRGPAFSLPDGDGRTHAVTPGATGRPLVVISHMGYY
ncbi:MAG: hypothetical protein QN174_05630 [Armatimonadota bacterium]|nr:hypothetical protein [Armatimonadota bacterium]MDR7421282.1 hypothetical protein [Armatimonadota bacterium]MDR7454085.1 hypothetical protein [Armatimonadota bacterium]MDR7455795.1 hypothetical protein [Armatimonadota bacterium]MDR7496421.1 hypothetical protein [Armatimonadota bacterium]